MICFRVKIVPTSRFALVFRPRYVFYCKIWVKVQKLAMITSGTSRKMDLADIDKLLFFIYKPFEKVVLYVDYIRLE